MIAAIYARLSVQAKGKADDAGSVARQVASARAFAQASGWRVDDAHVFTDTASGAEFARRPGLMRLLAALKPTPPFTMLLVFDRDRLGREQIETSYVLKQIVSAGVKVFEVKKGQGREITLATPTDKILASVTAFAGELEREQAPVRTHSALEFRARAGRSTGGRIFGYTSTRTPEGHVVRQVNDREAQTVRRAFHLATEGHGVKAIAKMLNAEAALAPRKGSGAAAGWAPSTVRSLLHNTVYRGVVMWNRTRKRDAWGQRKATRRDPADVIEVGVPDLTIIDASTWQAAHEHLDASRALYLAINAGRGRAGRPASGSASRYLLSGLGTCAVCRGSMHIRKRGEHRLRFGCLNHRLRGAAVCGNALETHLDDTDAAVLAAVEHDLLRAEILETALYMELEALQNEQDDQGQVEPLRVELEDLDAEVARLADAIEKGGPLEALLGRLQESERRRAVIRTAIDVQTRQRAAQRPDRDAVLVRLREVIGEWRDNLKLDTGSARAALQALLGARLVFTPGPHGYEFSAPGTVAPIIAGLVTGVRSRTRTIPPALRRALHYRDRGCRFPGCGVRVGQGYHIRHWAQGGPTTLANLALLCRQHHRAVHEEGYQVERQPDGQLQFRRPNGGVIPDVPRSPELPEDPGA